MTVYTVQSLDSPVRGPVDHCVIGTYTTRGRALDECVEYIMDRLELRDDFAWSMAHDENHPETEELFSELKDGATVVRRGCASKLKKLLRDELAGQGCYYVFDGNDSWHFDIDENGVEGELWHTVTWGNGDRGDPEFTTPHPKTFTGRETAVKTFLDYVKDLCRSCHMKWSVGFLRETRRSLERDGKVLVDLNDGRCVNCVLYHDDAKNIKE